MSVTVSIGISISGVESDEDLAVRADKALYAAKAHGRDVAALESGAAALERGAA